MKTARTFLLLTLVFFGQNAFAQNGFIRGTVIEDETGEPMYGVTVAIQGTTNGGITDFDGKFSISVEPGVYTIQAQFVSFKTITITGIEVVADKTYLIDQLRMEEDVEELEEVVVTAEVIKESEAALVTVKRKAANLVDGISAASFRKIGDSDAAAAAKRITGVSIEGGKYVYVRGLGDRYTKTLLNGMDIPGLDPDRNTLQMDIFPTNVLSNIIVSKSFTADLPASFTGGLVNIETADVPDARTSSAKIGIGFNPSMHFNSDYLTYDGGGTDWLGFDDGTRKLHIPDSEVVGVEGSLADPNSEAGRRFSNQLRGFNSQLGAIQQSSFMNFSLGFSRGDQKEIGAGTLGYNFAFTYSNRTEFFEDALFSSYLKFRNNDQLELDNEKVGDFGVNNVLLGGLVGLALKKERSKYRLSLMHLQNGESKAGIFDSETTPFSISSDLFGYESNLEYSQRGLTNLLLAGEYYMDTWNISWGLSPTLSSINDPDIRFTKYEVLPNNAGFDIGTGNSGLPQRIWRGLNEINVASRVDFDKAYSWLGRDAKLKLGLGGIFKQRDFIIRQFDLNVDQTDFVGDFDELMAEENLWPAEDGNFHVAQFAGGINVNEYDATVTNFSAYISNEFQPTEKLKAIIGVRAETYTQLYTGGNQQGRVLSDEKVLDEFNLFPSSNFIYAITEDMNLRASYTRTTARYSFKEASFIEYYDPLTGRTFLGSLSPIQDIDGSLLWDGEIESTLIDNFDLRWEKFSNRGQLVSVSAFYKSLSNPIEIVQIAASTNNFQPQNVGNAIVYGAELEFRQSLSFIGENYAEWFINGNSTFSVSEITMTDIEFDSRVLIADDNETVDRRRQLQGQSPYIINAGISYEGFENGLEVGVYYNVQGPTLAYTGGVRGKPDVYTIPFHSLNITANKSFGADDNMRLSLKVSNLLNDERQWEHQSANVADELFESRAPGTTVSLGFNYAF